MIRQRFYFALFIVAGLFWSAPTALAQPEPTRLDLNVQEIDKALENEWFGLYMEGKKIGYLNSTRAKVTENGKTVYRETTLMNMKLLSAFQKSELKVEQTMDFDNAAPFRLLRGSFVHSDGKISQRITLTAKGKGYEVVITLGGNEQKKDIGDLDYTLADSMGSELWVQRKPKKGEKITTRDLDMDELKIHLVTTTLLESKESLVNGVKVLFHEVSSLNHSKSITSESRYDEKGRLISGTVAGLMEMRRETEQQAKDTQFSSDLFLLGMAKINKEIGLDKERGAKTLTGLILEIESKDNPQLPDGPRQTLVAKGDGVYQLRIGKQHGKIVKATDKEIKEGLEETIAYPISDAKVKELAKKAVGNAKTDEEKAKNICKFVKDFIEPTLAATVPKMHDLMERKEGDCKSYALLFTCLCRANGLSSREVSGFVYMGDDIKAFGGHAWNEVLLDGYWVPVDASLNQVDADPTHICLGTDKESANNLLKTFGKLNFKLIEVQTNN